jgi:hypothetical protein
MSRTRQERSAAANVLPVSKLVNSTEIKQVGEFLTVLLDQQSHDVDRFFLRVIGAQTVA